MSEDGSAGAATVRIRAPAKINLALHVTGQRDDGYHLLDSVVVRANFGDTLTIKPADKDRFHITGPYASALAQDAPEQNLIIKARDRLRAANAAQACPSVSIELEKNLPIASGVGGGSADAAAALIGLAQFWQFDTSADAFHATALALGADVPMCLRYGPMRVVGIGEQISPLPIVPRFPIVAVNPAIGVSTPMVFNAMKQKDNVPLTLPLDGWVNADAFINWLATTTRNDLFEPALALCPAIGEVLDVIGSHGALLARMSGSGATCFGLFESDDAAARAAVAIQRDRQKWYVQAGHTLTGEL